MSNETNSNVWGPQMAASEHTDTYHAFLTGAKACGAAVAVVLILMAIFLL